MNEWYVLFVRTRSEEKIKKFLQKQLSDEYQPFIPMVRRTFRRNKKTIYEQHVCFPGYLFIQSSASSMEFMQHIYRYIGDVNDIYKILRHGGKYSQDIALNEETQRKLQTLLGKECCIEESVGLIEGNAIRIKSGPLVGFESIIRRLDRHKRQAVIELDILGDIRKVTVGLEIVEKKS